MSDDPRQALLQQVEAQRVAFINLQFTDILGMAKTVTLPWRRGRRLRWPG